MTPEHHAEAILRAATPAAFMYSRDGTYSRIHKSQQPSRYHGWTESPLYTAEAILAAVREAMEAERKAIADWLMADAVKNADEVRSLNARKKLTPIMSAEWDAMVQTKAGVAGAIERGEHLPTPPRGE